VKRQAAGSRRQSEEKQDFPFVIFQFSSFISEPRISLALRGVPNLPMEDDR
jgi:hypothetical protein